MKATGVLCTYHPSPVQGKSAFARRAFQNHRPSEVALELLYCLTPSESILDVSKPNTCALTVGEVTHLSEETANSQMQIGDVICDVTASGRVSRSLPVQVTNTFVKPAILTQE